MQIITNLSASKKHENRGEQRRTELEHCKAPGGSAEEQDGGGGSERAQCGSTESDSTQGPAAVVGGGGWRRTTTVCSLTHLGEVTGDLERRGSRPEKSTATLYSLNALGPLSLLCDFCNSSAGGDQQALRAIRECKGA